MRFYGASHFFIVALFIFLRINLLLLPPLYCLLYQILSLLTEYSVVVDQSLRNLSHV